MQRVQEDNQCGMLSCPLPWRQANQPVLSLHFGIKSNHMSLLLPLLIIHAPLHSAMALWTMKDASSHRLAWHTLCPVDRQPVGLNLKEPRLHHGKEAPSTTRSSSPSTINFRVLSPAMLVPMHRRLHMFQSSKVTIECSTWATARPWIRNPNL